MCHHNPCCPQADEVTALHAHILADHFEQGWCLLCNGVVLFDDGGAIFPDGHTSSPQRLVA